MADGVVDQAVLLAPVGGPPVQLGYQLRMGPLQAGAEQIGEQVVEAIPAALLVQGDEEQVGPLERLERVLTARGAGDGIAEGTAPALQDRGLEQECPHRLGLELQDLLTQVVEDEAMGAGEGVQEALGVGSVLE